jgi:hypothetical protein
MPVIPLPALFASSFCSELTDKLSSFATLASTDLAISVLSITALSTSVDLSFTALEPLFITASVELPTKAFVTSSGWPITAFVTSSGWPITSFATSSGWPITAFITGAGWQMTELVTGTDCPIKALLFMGSSLFLVTALSLSSPSPTAILGIIIDRFVFKLLSVLETGPNLLMAFLSASA